MNRELHLKSKTVYGKELLYPDCNISSLFHMLIGTKTFSNYDILHIKKLGYTVILNKSGGTIL
jgi:hypothetical protein